MGNKRKRNGPHRVLRMKKVLTILVSTLLVLILLLTAIAAKVLYDVKETTEEAYEPLARTQKLKTVDLKQQEPFSVLLLGVDTGSLGRSEQGRSDTIMVATVNPEKEKLYWSVCPVILTLKSLDIIQWIKSIMRMRSEVQR